MALSHPSSPSSTSRTPLVPAGVVRQLGRYRARHRAELLRSCADSDEFQDLVTSFPAACVEIVSRPTDDPIRQQAMRLVQQGARLLAIATALKLPPWFRRLPPAAVIEPLLGRAPPAVYEARFGTRVLNLTPREPLSIGRWLQAVLAARAVGDDAFAYWIAAQGPLFRHPGLRLPIQQLALFAFHSRHPELPAAQLIVTHWRDKMSLGLAAGETRRWLLTVLEQKCLCGPGCDDGRGLATMIDGFQFVPLISPASIIEDGREMNHCLAQYVSLAVCGLCRLYSIRKDGQRIATMEIRAADPASGPELHQLKGPRNQTPQQEVWTAARCWLGRNRDELARQFHSPVERHSNEAFARLVWGPYVRTLATEAGIENAPKRPPVGRILMQMRDLWVLEK